MQIKKDGNVNITSGGEYALIPKDFFYNLLENYLSDKPIEKSNKEVKLSKEDEILAKTIKYYNKLKSTE